MPARSWDRFGHIRRSRSSKNFLERTRRSTHDNTAANRLNPDSNQWVGFGNRTFHDMLQCHVLLYYMDDAEYQQQAAERQSKMKTMTSSNQ